MKNVIFMLTFSTLLCISLTAVQRERNNGPPGVCIPTLTEFGDLGQLQINETKQLPNACGVVSCTETDIIYQTCGVIVVDPCKYTIVKDLSLPYPGCCGTVVEISKQ